MNDPESKQIYTHTSMIISAHIFLGAADWTILYSIKLITYYLIIRFSRRVSLVQSVARRRIRAEIICLRVNLLALGVIHACQWVKAMRWLTPVLARLFLRWRSRVTENRCKNCILKTALIVNALFVQNAKGKTFSWAFFPMIAVFVRWENGEVCICIPISTPTLSGIK